MARFSDRLVTILNHGALNLGIGLGYRLRLFDILDRADSPMTLDDLADQSGLNRRYLEEWMGIMVTGGIIDPVPAEDSPDTGGRSEPGKSAAYVLPRERGDLLCRRAGSGNLGVYCQEIPLLTACAMSGVAEGFKTGKGVPFAQYDGFQTFMTELADAKHEKMLVPEFLPSVDQGRLVEQLRSGIRVLDLGCGQGTAVHLMARAFPETWFTGLDNHGPAIRRARETAARLGLENIEFIEMDAAALKDAAALNASFHWVCAFDAIHDQSRPLQVLEGIRQVLREDGSFSMIDIRAESGIPGNMDHPMAPFLYTVSLMHCTPVGLNDNGAGLGMMWGRQQAADLLEQAGFSSVSAEEIPNDPFNLHFFCRP